jgi:hypothetical protein
MRKLVSVPLFRTKVAVPGETQSYLKLLDRAILCFFSFLLFMRFFLSFPSSCHLDS